MEPEVTVQDGVTKLTENQDYTLVYAKNIRKGTGYVIVKGKGKYRGYTECVPFRIGSKTIEKEEKSNEVTDVVTSEVNGKTQVKFTAAESNVGNYRVFYRNSNSEEWQHVDTNRTEVFLDGEQSQVKVATVKENKVIATATPKNNKKTDIIDKAVQNDTELSGVSKAKTNKVRLIDKEVSNDVTTSSGKN